MEPLNFIECMLHSPSHQYFQGYRIPHTIRPRWVTQQRYQTIRIFIIISYNSNFILEHINSRFISVIRCIKLTNNITNPIQLIIKHWKNSTDMTRRFSPFCSPSSSVYFAQCLLALGNMRGYAYNIVSMYICKMPWLLLFL